MKPDNNNALYFTHDKYMRNDPKIRYLEKFYPNCFGYGVYCKLLEILTDEDYFELRLDDKKYKWISIDIGVDIEQLKQLITIMVDAELFRLEDRQGISYLFSAGLKDRLEPLMAKRARMKEMAEKRWAKDMPTHSTGSATAMQSKEEENKTKKSRGEKSKEKNHTQDFFDNMGDADFDTSSYVQEYGIKLKDLQKFYKHYTQDSGGIPLWQTFKAFDIGFKIESWKDRDISKNSPENSLTEFESILAKLEPSLRKKVENEAIKWLETDKTRKLGPKSLQSMIEKYA